jgi:diaminopimelate epimerase
MGGMSYPFLKGHGTENDFVLLPDPDGHVHGDLSPQRVRALCDRRAGIGGDGVIRVVRDADGRWFMDYRNSDGSVSEMCGNGVRVLARYLLDIEGESFPLEIATRAGVKTVTIEGDGFSVDMGRPRLLGESEVAVGERHWKARHVDMGNPHAVAMVESLDDAGDLLSEPAFDHEVYPEGVNIEFVVPVAERHIAMRVHERGSGGTGACAAGVAVAEAEGRGRGTTYDVDVPGGRVRVTWTDDDRVLLSGPAVLVASGTTDL